MWDQGSETIILMATYNGESFLAEQLESIVNQSNEDWQLLIRDDGSKDATLAIIDQFVRDDSRIRLIHDHEKQIGPARSFSRLMQVAYPTSAKYVAFADQDDVWMPSKLQKQLEIMHDLEDSDSPIPALVHSDMEVVDDELRRISPSFMHYQGIQNEVESPLSVLLVQNFVSGCAAIVNKPLLRVALPMSENVLMHDWWLALVAAAVGRIGYTDESLIRYRQHGGNAVGATSICKYLNPFSMDCYRRWKLGRKNFERTIAQASDLADVLDEKVGSTNSDLAREYVAIQGLAPIQRVLRLHKLGVHAQSKLRNMLLLSRLLLLRQVVGDASHHHELQQS